MTPGSVSWSLPSEMPALGNREVHVWCASLDRDKPSVQRLWPTLADSERTRAQRFHFCQDRKRYIVGRGLLRAILGHYLAVEPNRLQFCYNPYGKPSLDTDCGGKTLRFNISHAQGFALYAITRHREVGVDLEYIRPNLADAQIAERFFAPGEVMALRTVPASAREKAFFTCWTRKEAYIKATGKGVSIPLDGFEVSLRPGEPAALLGTSWDVPEASRWSLRDLYPAIGYVGALCVEGHSWQLNCWQWPKG